MWTARGVVLFVLHIVNCLCQDINQETTPLENFTEKLFNCDLNSNMFYDSVLDISNFSDELSETEDTHEALQMFYDSPVEITTTFENIFMELNSIDDWRTDNLTIFGQVDENYWNGFDIERDSTTALIHIEKTTRDFPPTKETIIEIDGDNNNVYSKRIDVEDISANNYVDQPVTTENEYSYSAFEDTTTQAPKFENASSDGDMSEIILKMLEELKNPELKGIPGVNILDPYPIPDMSQSITIFDKLLFTNSAVRGLSELRILYITADFKALEVYAAMYIDILQTSGHYSYRSFMMNREGPYSIVIHGLLVTARANIGVQDDGTLRAQDIIIDLVHTSIDVNFENLDPLLGGVVNSAGNFIFDSAKPYMLDDAYHNVRKAIDDELEKQAEDMQFPNSLPVLDMVLFDVGTKIKELGLDPYEIGDYVNDDNMPFINLSISKTSFTGLSTLHRIGNMTVKIANGGIEFNFGISSKELQGSTRWSAIFGAIANNGEASLAIEHISLKINITQPLDTRKTPLLNNLQIDVGNIQLRSEGAGTFDYILEFCVNIIPNLLRSQIIAALEWPLRYKIQEELNKINVEQTVKELLPQIVEMQKNGYKLSYLRSVKEGSYDEDAFFNF